MAHTLAGGRPYRDPVTFSIVARDPVTGELGVAVTTCVLAVGAVCPGVRPGVGAVSTQAHARWAYRPEVLDRLAAGEAAPAALAAAVAADAGREERQVGVVDAAGGAAAWTGRGCVPWAGHRSGDGWTVQGNLLTGPEVVEAVAAAYTGHPGPLPRRLLAALQAGQARGGDLRGTQSAALLVLSPPEDPADTEAVLRGVDLRVDDAADPLRELDRLLGLHEAYVAGDHAALARQGPAGERELHAALAALAAGDLGTAADRLASLRARPGWEAWLDRLAGRDGEPLVRRLVALAER